MSSSINREREFMVSVRLNADEKLELMRRAEDLALSVADYTRSIMIERRPLGVVARHRVASKYEKEIATLVTNLSKLNYELNKIGVNINQMAHAANSSNARSIPHITDDAKLSECLNLIAEIKPGAIEALSEILKHLRVAHVAEPQS